MQQIIRLSALLVLAMAPISARAGLTISENFDDISTLAGDGWVTTNNSSPTPADSWFQGFPADFSAHEGADNAYIAVGFRSVVDTPSPNGTISNWLITPETTMNNGDILTFYTRGSGPAFFADRLQVRFSTNGASTDVGNGAFDVGDFANLLVDINPNYEVGTPDAFPEDWTEFSITLSGLANPVSGRFAFRYFVEDAGPSGNNSDLVGIDTVSFSVVPEPSSGLLLLVGSVYLLRRRRA